MELVGRAALAFQLRTSSVVRALDCGADTVARQNLSSLQPFVMTTKPDSAQ
jgi:hypothetical protein